MKYCAARGCPTLVPLGVRHCPPHAIAEDRRRHAKNVAHGLYTAEWKAKRVRALEAHGYLCQLRLPGCAGRATTVHVPQEWAGDHVAVPAEELIPACASCHGTHDAPRAQGAKDATRTD